MPRNPHDLLADYLEAESLLESLRRKRTHFLEQTDDQSPGEAPGFVWDAGEAVVREEAVAWGEEKDSSATQDAPDVLKALEAGIEKAQALLLEYERHLELHLQGMADEAERGRLLFLEVSKRVVEFQALVKELGQELTPLETTQWERLLEDYHTLRREWVLKIPPEECPPLLE